MTTSGVQTLSVSRNDIILAAMEDIGAYAPGMETPPAGEVASCALRLNMMIKAWQAAGVGLWLRQWLGLPLQGGTPKYEIGPTGDHCSATMFRQTLSATALTGAATVTLTDASSVSNADAIGIAGDTNYIHWTTVIGAPVGNVVTLTAVLTDDCASGNRVYFYTPADIAARPIEVVGASLWTPTGDDVTVAGVASTETGTITALTPLSRQEYFSLPNQYSEGPPNSFYYNPTLTNGELHVWPVHTDMSCDIILDVRTPIQVFVNIPDEPDFPAEWFDALHYGLALRLCAPFKVPMNDYIRIKELAQITLSDADGFDREQDTSVFIQPNFGPGGY